MVVQHNLQAMNANRMLGINAKASAGSTEKLSSGYRINRAADDAAGLAISEKMRKQIRGLDQASANSEDGISCVQTAEGALAEVQDMLQRMNELVVQAANGTNSKTDRQYIQDEIDQLVTEIDRVSETTKFNELYLLKGDEEVGTTKSYMTNYSVSYTRNSEAGIANGGPQIKYNYTGSSNIYMVSTTISNQASNNPLSAKVVQTGDDITPYLNDTAATIHSDYKAFINVEINTATISANATPTTKANYDLQVNTSTSVIEAARDLYIYDTKTNTVTHLSEGDQMAQYLDDNRQIKSDYRLIAEVSDQKVTNARGGDPFEWDERVLEKDQTSNMLYDADGNVVSGMALDKFFDENGNYKGGLFKTQQARATDQILSDSATSTIDRKIGTYIKQSATDVPNDLQFDLQVGADSDRQNKLTASIMSLSAAGLGIDKLHSSKIGIVDKTGDNATDAIDVIAEALQRVSTQRSALGAIQNRLEHTIKNLDNVVENTTAAESAIRDTDMAEEMVAYSNNNILLQAGQSMLSQANQANQGVLSLLQ